MKRGQTDRSRKDSALEIEDLLTDRIKKKVTMQMSINDRDTNF